MSSIRWLAPLIVVWAAGTSPSTGQVKVRLDSLIAHSIEHDPGIAARLSDADAAREALIFAGLLPEPGVSLVVQPFPVYTARGAQRSIWRAEQQFPWPGKRSGHREAAEARSEVALWSANAYREDLAWQIRHIYAAWHGLEQERMAVSFHISMLEAMEEAAALQYELGRGPQQSILKAQIEKNRLGRRLVKLDMETAGIRAELESLTGLGLSGSQPEDPRLFRESVAPPWLERDQELRSLAAAIRAAEAEATIASLSGKPDVSVSLLYIDIADTAVPVSATGADAVGIGLALKLPTRRDSYRARHRQRLAEARALEERYADRLQLLEAELRGVDTALSAAEQALRLLTGTLIPQAESALNATTVAYSNGRAGFLDLLDAERTRFDLELDKISTETRAHQLKARLMRLGNATSDVPEANE